MIRFVANPARLVRLVALILLAGTVAPLQAQREIPGAGENSAEWVTIEMIPSHEAVPAGSTMQIGFQVRVQEGWFVHSNTPAYSLFTPVRLMIEETPGVTVRSVRYPAGQDRTVSYAGQPFNVYDGTFHVLAEIEFNEQLAPRELTLQMMMNFQACDEELCIPPAGTVYRVPVTILAPDADPVPLNVERLAEISEEMDASNSSGNWRPWLVLGLLLVVGWMVGKRIRRRSGAEKE